MTQEALKLALEALENGDVPTPENVGKNLDAITAIKKALAQTQEPFAWAEFDGEGSYYLSLYKNNETYAEDWNKRNPNHIGWVEPIYKHPPQRTWVGLTDEERAQCVQATVESGEALKLMLLIEAKLKEMNT